MKNTTQHEQTTKQDCQNTSYFNDCNVNGEPAVNESNRYNTAEDFYDAYSKNVDEFIDNGEFAKNVDEVNALNEVVEANLLTIDFKFLFAALTSKTLTKECKADLLKGVRPSILETLNKLAKTIITLQVTENGFRYAEESEQG